MNPQTTTEFWKEQGSHAPSSLRAFTLLELLVVITIIGLLATIGLPAIRGMTKSNALAAANRQLLDDFSFARSRAIADHTSVYMVFIPTIDNFPLPAVYSGYGDSGRVIGQLTNLYTGAFATYALIALRTAGDQPGVNTAHYLTDWRRLPVGVYIATNKYVQTPFMAPTFFFNNANSPEFPFPSIMTNSQVKVSFPHIGFNYLGQPIYRSNNADYLVMQADANNQIYIPLARGSIFANPDGTVDVAEAHNGDAYYTNYSSLQAARNQPLPPPYDSTFYNQIYIDPLTGRARVQHLDIQ